jgi:peptide/nickel transport system substrate-binding protein
MESWVSQPESGMTRRELAHRAAAIGLSAPALAGLISACSDDEPASKGGAGKRGGVVQIALGGGTLQETLDPAVAAGTVNNVAIGQIADTLLELDPKTWEPRPALAESWETNGDASEWTLHLRDGVEWHDGKPLTSSDVVYSLRRHLDEKVGSSLLTNYEPFVDQDGIQAVDKRTVQLTLKRPNAFFYLALGMHRSQVIQEGTTKFDTLVGTGPFRVKSFNPGRSFQADRNPGYWRNGLPLLDEVRGVAIPEVAGQVRSVVSGESHIATDIDFAGAQEAERRDDLDVIFVKGEQNLPIILDVRKEPFSDKRVRDALKLAVDRQRVVDVAFHGNGEVGNDFPAPPSDGLYPPDLPPPEADPDEARRLLAEAGYPNGIDLTLNASEAGAAMIDEAVVFAESVRDAGIRVQVERVPADTYWDRIWLVKPMYVSNWNRRHPWQFLSELFRTNAEWNESKIDVPQIDELLNEAARTTAPQEQKRLIWDALELVRDEAGWIVPGWVHQIFLAKQGLEGVKLGALASLDLSEASLA